MRTFFLVILVFLGGWSLASYWTLPDREYDVPVLYWVTDPNPARELQVEMFHRWMEKNDFPKVHLKIDTSNSDGPKKTIQGISGVAGDIMDSGGSQIGFFQDIGIALDVTDYGVEMGFSPDKTYPALDSLLVYDGRQYAFPCNVGFRTFVVNKETFERHGVSLPPSRWTLDEFETHGKDYVVKANAGLKRQVNFFVDQIDRVILSRSMGLDVYNETMTRCILGDPRYAEVLRRVRQWIQVDRIMPSSADLASFDTLSGYGGANMQLFNAGNFAMVFTGRYSVIQFRQFNPPIDLGVVELPHGGFPNNVISSRAAVIYAGSPNRHLAVYFLKFLASQEYNQLIVEDGDALPPDPMAAESELFSTPKAYPNEWEFHAPFRDAAHSICIAETQNPFIVGQAAKRIEKQIYDGLMAGIHSPEEASLLIEAQINREIQRSVEDNEGLKLLYNQRLLLQSRIDRLKEAGEPIPSEFIFNPFYRVYSKDEYRKRVSMLDAKTPIGEIDP